MHDSTEIRALVSLLADEDPKITNLIWEHLARIGHAALPSLKEACEARDPRLRMRARFAVAQLSLDDVEKTLQDLASADEAGFDLEGAFCALARIVDPEVNRSEVTWALDDIAARIQPHLKGLTRPMERACAVTQVFHNELKFTGVLPNWNDLEPACIHRVLERREGIPITLSAIYLMVARRLRLPMFGVSLPHHFLVKYASGAQEIFIDPFYGGQILTRRECIQSYLRDYYPKDSYIHQAGPREIVVRALRGLILLYAKRQDKGRVRRLTRFLEILQVRERAR